jgi:hypothetical protein
MIVDKGHVLHPLREITLDEIVYPTAVHAICIANLYLNKVNIEYPEEFQAETLLDMCDFTTEEWNSKAFNIVSRVVHAFFNCYGDELQQYSEEMLEGVITLDVGSKIGMIEEGESLRGANYWGRVIKIYLENI